MKNLYGLIGEKLSHSISPIIHQLIFKYSNIEGDYSLFELQKEELETFIKSCNLRGFNITIPYKIDIMKYLDSITDEAKGIGAVNTVKIKDKKTYGYNTDYHGIHMTFEKHDVNLNNASAVILGAGGASAAVLQYLLDNNCSDITFVMRNRNKLVNEKLSNYNIITYDELSKIQKKDILINCTPVGMHPDTEKSPVSKAFIEGFNFIFDLIYNPLQTKLLTYAEESNIKCSNGLLMLVGQAVYAEAIWNEIPVSSELVDKIYKELMQRGI